VPTDRKIEMPLLRELDRWPGRVGDLLTRQASDSPFDIQNGVCQCSVAAGRLWRGVEQMGRPKGRLWHHMYAMLDMQDPTVEGLSRLRDG